MKRRQDEDMMRQQDLIEKQKEQARYDSVSIASLHDWLVETETETWHFAIAGEAKISRTRGRRAAAWREKVSTHYI